MAWIQLPQEPRPSLMRTAFLTRLRQAEFPVHLRQKTPRSIPNVLVPNGRLHEEDNGAGRRQAVGNGYSRCRLDEPIITAQNMDYLGEENRRRNCPSGRRICSTKYTHRWPTALCVGYCGQGVLSTNRQCEVLRNGGNRRTPLLQFKKNPIRTAKSAFPNAYIFRGLFFPRSRGTRGESPGGIAVEGST